LFMDARQVDNNMIMLWQRRHQHEIGGVGVSITVKLSAGFSRGIERTIPDGTRPTVGTLLLPEPLEAYGIDGFKIEVNGQRADYNTELRESDHVELITPRKEASGDVGNDGRCNR